MQPITEHSVENSEKPWLGTALPLDEWNDSGEYDEIIKKANLKSKMKSRKDEARKSIRKSNNLSRLYPGTSKQNKEETYSNISDRSNSPRTKSPPP